MEQKKDCHPYLGETISGVAFTVIIDNRVEFTVIIELNLLPYPMQSIEKIIILTNISIGMNIISSFQISQHQPLS